MRENIILESKRLILRHWQPDDAEDLFMCAKYEEIGYPCGWKAHSSVNYSRQIIVDYFSQETLTFALVLKTTNRPIGCVSLRTYGNSTLLDNDKQAEIGYWLGKPYWGQNLMPEAVNCLLDFVFNKLGLEEVFGGYYEGNDKSRKVMQKCGFKYQYTIKEKYLKTLQETRMEHVLKLSRNDFLNK